MSKNNLILVVKDKRGIKEWYYVISNVNADTEWNHKFCIKKIKYMKKNGKSTVKRYVALLIAHDIDNRIKTEYGVRELTVNKFQKTS